jgi:hypothetical protein
MILLNYEYICHLGIGTKRLGLVGDHRAHGSIHLRVGSIKIEARFLPVQWVGRSWPRAIVMLLLRLLAWTTVCRRRRCRWRNAAVDVSIVVPWDRRRGRVAAAAAYPTLWLRLLMAHDSGDWTPVLIQTKY